MCYSCSIYFIQLRRQYIIILLCVKPVVGKWFLWKIESDIFSIIIINAKVSKYVYVRKSTRMEITVARVTHSTSI